MSREAHTAVLPPITASTHGTLEACFKAAATDRRALFEALVQAETTLNRILNHALVRLPGDAERQLITARTNARAAIQSATGEG